MLPIIAYTHELSTTTKQQQAEHKTVRELLDLDLFECEVRYLHYLTMLLNIGSHTAHKDTDLCIFLSNRTHISNTDSRGWHKVKLVVSFVPALPQISYIRWDSLHMLWSKMHIQRCGTFNQETNTFLLLDHAPMFLTVYKFLCTRYKISLVATDGTDEAEFVLFGKIGQQIVRKPVINLLRANYTSLHMKLSGLHEQIVPYRVRLLPLYLSQI